MLCGLHLDREVRVVTIDGLIVLCSRQRHVTLPEPLFMQGRVVRKLVNANAGLKVIKIK